MNNASFYVVECNSAWRCALVERSSVKQSVPTHANRTKDRNPDKGKMADTTPSPEQLQATADSACWLWTSPGSAGNDFGPTALPIRPYRRIFNQFATRERQTSGPRCAVVMDTLSSFQPPALPLSIDMRRSSASGA